MAVDESTQTVGVSDKSESTQTNGVPSKKEPDAGKLNESATQEEQWSVESGM